MLITKVRRHFLSFLKVGRPTVVECSYMQSGVMSEIQTSSSLEVVTKKENEQTITTTTTTIIVNVGEKCCWTFSSTVKSKELYCIGEKITIVNHLYFQILGIQTTIIVNVGEKCCWTFSSTVKSKELYCIGEKITIVNHFYLQILGIQTLGIRYSGH